MKDFLKLYGLLISKGFATADEKAKLKELATEADEAKVEEVEALPETLETEDELVEEVAKSVFAKMEKAIEKSLSKFSAETIENTVESVSKNLAKQNRDRANKAGLFNADVKEMRKEANQQLIAKLKSFSSQGVIKSGEFLSGGENEDGGYTIDETLFAEINLLLTEYGVARREMRVLNLRGRKANLNALASDVAVNWTSEGGRKSLTKFTIDQVNAELQKMTAIVPWSDELAEDTEIDVVDFLANRFAEKISEKEDDAFFNGDGSPTYAGITGVLNSALTSVTMTGTTFESMDADDLIDMVDALPQGAHANAKFYLHRTNMSTIRRLKDNEGQYIYQRPSEAGPATIWGYPVVLVEAMPSKADSSEDTPFVVFGDLRKAYTIVTKTTGTEFMISREGTLYYEDEEEQEQVLSLYQQDLSALRVKNRVGGVTVLPNAIVTLKTAPISG